MQINYIEVNGKKLFSFHRHDFQQFETGEFIDGGFDYTRSNTEVKTGEISDLIADIREQFTWTSHLNKDGTLAGKPTIKLLKDLDTDHIIAILIHLTKYFEKHRDQVTSGRNATQLILLNELRYRDDTPYTI